MINNVVRENGTRSEAFDNGSSYTYYGDRSYKDFRTTNGTAGQPKGQRDVAHPTSYHYDYHVVKDCWYERYTATSRQINNPSWYLINTNRVTDCSAWDYTARGSMIPSDRWRDWASLENRNLKKIFDQLSYGKGNLAVDLAESRQTIQMIKNVTSVRKMVQQFSREVLKPQKGLAASKRLKYASDRWLEYRYGWLPFVNSTYELLRTLSKRVDNKTQFVTLRSRSSWENSGQFATTLPGAYGALTGFRTEKQSVKSELCGVYRARTSLELYDFTSLNPLGIAWELVPYSFVVDWFVNIGETMELWENYIKFAHLWRGGYRTNVWREDVFYSTSVNTSSPIPYWPNGQPITGTRYQNSEVRRCRRIWAAKDRTYLGSLPTPAKPSINVNVGAKRMLDACALLRSAFVKSTR